MSKEIAKTDKKTALEGLLNGPNFQQALAKSLPRHLKADRFVRIALTAFNKTPKLRECTQESLFACLLDLSMLGLEPDGRRAHLIPFKDRRSDTTKCTLIVDYKGIIDLVLRSGKVSYLKADVVYENDEFDFQDGSESFLRHKRVFKDRGEPMCVYSFATMTDGSQSFDIMSMEDVDSIRRRSKTPNDGPWKTDKNEMAKKSVFKRHSKWLPMSYEIRDIIDKDNEHASFDSNIGFENAKPVGESEEPPDDAEPTPLEKLLEWVAENKINDADLLEYCKEMDFVQPGATSISMIEDSGIEKFLNPKHLKLALAAINTPIS